MTPRGVFGALAHESVVVDTCRAEYRQAVEERGIHRACCRWLRQELLCSTCATADERVTQARRRLARAEERR